MPVIVPFQGLATNNGAAGYEEGGFATMAIAPIRDVLTISTLLQRRPFCINQAASEQSGFKGMDDEENRIGCGAVWLRHDGRFCNGSTAAL